MTDSSSWRNDWRYVLQSGEEKPRQPGGFLVLMGQIKAQEHLGCWSLGVEVLEKGAMIRGCMGAVKSRTHEDKGKADTERIDSMLSGVLQV